MAQDLLNRCEFETAPRQDDGSVRCAVSGGPDSLALLVLARAQGLEVEAVHVDHGLRPGSAAEADVVAAAAHRFGARFRAETAPVAEGGDLEARARRIRRDAVGRHALTGHTSDDQAETILAHLLRGSGLRGLAAMTPGGIHPILGLRRSETHALCHASRLEPVTDPSNADPRFLRNRVRNELIPLLGEIAQRDPVPALTRFADLARGADETLDTLAGELDPTDSRLLAAAPPELARRALRRWLRLDEYPPTSSDIERAMAVVRHERRACQLSGRRRISRHQGRLVLTTEPPDTNRDRPADESGGPTGKGL